MAINNHLKENYNRIQKKVLIYWTSGYSLSNSSISLYPKNLKSSINVPPIHK